MYKLFDFTIAHSEKHASFIAIANAGFTLVLSQIYTRLKEKRDNKRKRAQDLFIEWHSKEIRESRIYVSRWLSVNGNEKGRLPSLKQLESDATHSYNAHYRRAHLALTKSQPVVPSGLEPQIHELDDVALREFHFSKIYAFFERWALLVKNDDIDHTSASDYMRSYKQWYLENFFAIWAKHDDDGYIKKSIEEIIFWVTPNH